MSENIHTAVKDSFAFFRVEVKEEVCGVVSIAVFIPDGREKADIWRKHNSGLK